MGRGQRNPPAELRCAPAVPAGITDADWQRTTIRDNPIPPLAFRRATRAFRLGALCASAEDLAEKMEQVLQQPDWRQRLQTQAQSRAQARYGWDEVAAQYEKLFA